MNRARFGVLAPVMFGSRYIKPVINNPVMNFMVANNLDSRVLFTAPPHLYFAEDGTVKTSAANTWPLQYRNGVAIGRHEPERASQNYLPSTNFEVIAASGTTDWIFSSGSNVTVEDSSLGVKAGVANINSIYGALYSETTGGFIIPQFDAGSPTDWSSVVRKVANPSAAMLRWYTARASSTLYLYGKSLQVPAGNIVASFIRRVDSNSVDTVLAQIEPGSNRTSTIINGAGQSNSRTAMTAVINEPLAVGATVQFSNGDTLDLTAENGVITIPVTTQDWMTRYIQTVTLR